MNIIPDFWNKTLIIDNENNIGISDEIIEILEENNLKIYQAMNIEKAFNILKEYNINFYIINICFFFDFINKIPENSKIILLLNLNQLDILNKILIQMNNSVEILDYFFIPIDKNLLLQRIKFFILNKKQTSINIVETNLEKFLLDGLLQQENQLHNLIWNDNYNHYILKKYSQYIIFFSHIFALLKDYLSSIPNMEIIGKITDLIGLQMYFFNCYITFKITGQCSNNYNRDIKYFLLFLVFLGELFKIENINTEILLHFFIDNNKSYVRIELDKNLNAFLNRYNQMYLESYHLFHYIQGYLWNNWRKNINFSTDKNLITIEFSL